jgi:hypothetical protein
MKIAHCNIGLLAIPLLVFVGMSPAHAGCTLRSPTTWNIPGNGDWTTAGDWNPAVVPNSPTTNVCITNGTSAVAVGPNVDVGSLQVASGNTLTIQQSLGVDGPSVINAGEINVEGALALLDNVTLSGGNIIHVTSEGNIVGTPGGAQTLTNQNNTIQGAGVIGGNGLSLLNESGGTFYANVPGSGMNLEGGGLITNQGLLAATNGSTLAISNNVNNAGGNITANNGLVGLGVDFNPITLTGGALNTLNGGIIDGLDVTLNGVAVSSGSTLTVAGPVLLQGTLTNQGTVSVPGLMLGLTGGEVTLTGGGSIVMSGASFNVQSSGVTLNNVNNVIQGNFQLEQNGSMSPINLINQSAGVVDANVSIGTVLLNGGGTVTNQGLLEATNGGGLGVDDSVNNSGGNITASGGFVSLGVFSPVTITGGTLNTAGPGVMDALSATLNGVTLSTGSTLTVDGPAALQGTFTNRGTVEVPNLNLTITGGNVTLTGGGTVVMSGNAVLGESSSGLTLNNVNNLIQGTGELGQNGMSLINQGAGVVNANVSGGTLLLDGGGLVTNHGLMEATNGGILEIINNLNNAGGTVTADGGLVLVNGATVTNTGTVNIRPSGALNVGAGAYIQTAGETIVDGVFSSLAPIQLEGGVLTGTGTIVGSVDNTGGVIRPGDAPGTLTIDNAYTQGSAGILMIDLGGTAPGSYSVLDVGGLATLDGTVEFTLVDGFTPQAGDVFSYLLSGSLAGDFTHTEFTNWSCPQDDSCTSGPNGSLDIAVQTASSVPEPSPLALLALGTLGMLSQRKRRSPPKSRAISSAA